MSLTRKSSGKKRSLASRSPAVAVKTMDRRTFSSVRRHARRRRLAAQLPFSMDRQGAGGGDTGAGQDRSKGARSARLLGRVRGRRGGAERRMGGAGRCDSRSCRALPWARPSRDEAEHHATIDAGLPHHTPFCTPRRRAPDRAMRADRALLLRSCPARYRLRLRLADQLNGNCAAKAPAPSVTPDA